MGTTHKLPYLFTPKPLFGLDIGRGSLKVVQLANEQRREHPKPTLIGYGSTTFDSSAIEEGLVTKPEIIAKAAQDLFRKHLIGDITNHQVAITIPAYRTFTRSIQLPLLKDHELTEAVRLEAEQYVPVPLDELYLDYTTISKSARGLEVHAVAVPKTIIQSYLDLTAIMGLEPILIETSMNAAGRLFERDPQSDVPSVIVDFGSLSSDISIYDRGIVTVGNIEGGGQIFTELIEKKLGVTTAEAQVIKTKYGLGVSRRQKEIHAALEPTLQKILKEIRRLMRYHDERYGSDKPIQQVIAVGGGANMPGMSEFFTNNLRVAVRSFDPWSHIDYHHLQPPSPANRAMYTTAIGVALARSHEVFK